MLLTSTIFEPAFLESNDLFVELYIPYGKDLDECVQWEPFVRTVHLPYSDINLAADDENVRRKSIDMVKDVTVQAARYPQARLMVLHPCGVFSFQGEEVGSYGHMIDSLRELADFMCDRGLVLSLENQVLRHPDLRVIAGCYCAEWLQLYKDVGRSNVNLTLDTSHAASAVAHEEKVEDRYKKLWEFMEHPDLIAHFHWSDARLQTNEAQWGDMHLVPGSGDLPRDFHRAIMQHSGSKLFEQKCSEAELAAGLEFVRSL